MSNLPIDLSEQEARAEICRVGASLFARGYVHATAGNISVRLPHGFLITPTDACLGQLEPDALALLDLQGQQISGARASKTIVLHRRIYEASAATPQPARCIIHTHSTHTVACSLQAEMTPGQDADLLPPITPYFVMKVAVCRILRITDQVAPEAAELVAQTITQNAAAGRPIRAVMLARLGPNVWHDSPAQAMAALEELEETARLWVLSGWRVPSLTPEQIDELRQSFAANW